MTCARRAEAERTGGERRLCCMRAGRASAMAQVAETCGTTRGREQEKGGRKVSRERGTRGNESRAKVLSLQTWQSSRKSQNPPTISRSTSPRHGKTIFVCVRVYMCSVCMYIRLRDRGALHASESASERRPSPTSSILVAYLSVLEQILTQARACLRVG